MAGVPKKVTVMTLSKEELKNTNLRIHFVELSLQSRLEMLIGK